jgi:hypothetical protein
MQENAKKEKEKAKKAEEKKMVEDLDNSPWG